MPIYEYSCQICGLEFETIVFGQKEEVCPSCGAAEVRRLMSAAAIGLSSNQQAAARTRALNKINPSNPREVAGYFKERGSRFGDAEFRGSKSFQNAVDRVSRGGKTLKE